MKKARHLGNYFVIGMTSVIALYAAVWVLGYLLEHSFRRMLDKSSDTTISETLVSPNGEQVATTYVNMGGGAAGWCSIGVAIRNKREPFSENTDNVFAANCGTKVNLKWESNNNLRISYRHDNYILSLYQKRLSNNKDVRIIYTSEAITQNTKANQK